MGFALRDKILLLGFILAKRKCETWFTDLNLIAFESHDNTYTLCGQRVDLSAHKV
jgi:hypothetical protein